MSKQHMKSASAKACKVASATWAVKRLTAQKYMLVRVVEKPLLEVVMSHADNNQSCAAEWLGLNHNTLRKKLIEHKLL